MTAKKTKTHSDIAWVPRLCRILLGAGVICGVLMLVLPQPTQLRPKAELPPLPGQTIGSPSQLTKTDLPLPPVQTTGPPSQLHSMIMQKRVRTPSAHQTVCERALSPEGRDTDPFGVPLWSRVILEHRASKFGDCRTGQKDSGCSAFTAQGLQDVFLYTAVWRHFNRTGVYIDLAANDYFYISNTFFADHCLKFDGICIEANPQYHSDLEKKRRCMLERICVAEKEKPVEFNFRGVFGGIVGAKKDGRGEIGEIQKMTCQPLSAVLRKYDVRHVDYMNLDVEGVELQCLQGIDWGAVTIDIIGIEVNPSFQQLEDFLVNKGYIKTVVIAHDAVFVHKSATTVLHILSAWRRDECPRLNEMLKPIYNNKNAIPRC